MQYFLVAGHQLMAWALGVALIVVFLDLGPGLTRDHPPAEWRVAGLIVAPLALLSVISLALSSPPWVCLLIAVPFVAIATAYSLAWLRRQRALERRALGWQTCAVGCFAMLVLMLTAGPNHWSGGVVMGVYGASAGSLGGLTYFIVQSFADHSDDALYDNLGPFGVPARVLAAGLGLTALAVLEALGWALGGHTAWAPVLGSWTVLSLLVPGALMAVGHKFYPRLQRPIWIAALASTLGGQATIYVIMLNYPGLIPSGIM